MSACKAVLRLDGTNHRCDLDAPHPGIAHRNYEIDALWCSHGEARAAKQPTDSDIVRSLIPKWPPNA
jgi:hypothetical protein